jgi:hypothetical protein
VVKSFCHSPLVFRYTIESEVKLEPGSNGACGHAWKVRPGFAVTRSFVDKAWGFFGWSGGGRLYPTEDGVEGSIAYDV